MSFNFVRRGGCCWAVIKVKRLSQRYSLFLSLSLLFSCCVFTFSIAFLHLYCLIIYSPKTQTLRRLSRHTWLLHIRIHCIAICSIESQQDWFCAFTVIIHSENEITAESNTSMTRGRSVQTFKAFISFHITNQNAKEDSYIFCLLSAAVVSWTVFAEE